MSPSKPTLIAALSLALCAGATGARADEAFWSWFSGDWSLTLGAAGMVAPDYEGSDSYSLSAAPIISLGRKGSLTRFSSRNDSASLAILDTGRFRIGPAAKLLLPRNDDDSADLVGLRDVPWGIEAGLFADVYATDWLRLRAEVRKGIHAHHGVVADLSADGFVDLTPTLRLSGGPRLSLATASYYQAYYGVDAGEALASGLSPYAPGGGLRSAGFGGALTLLATDTITTSVFAEYSRLLGPAAESSLVEERGSVNQLLVGVSATYRFDFAM
jgi:outer membrane scaffolding protein for murein synthesis (MipA/OmpV family)